MPVTSSMDNPPPGNSGNQNSSTKPRKRGGNRTYTVRAGDSPAKIAKALYGDERYFNEVVAAAQGAMLVPGMELTLPDLRDYQADLAKKGQRHFVSQGEFDYARNTYGAGRASQQTDAPASIALPDPANITGTPSGSSTYLPPEQGPPLPPNSQTTGTDTTYSNAGGSNYAQLAANNPYRPPVNRPRPGSRGAPPYVPPQIIPTNIGAVPWAPNPNTTYGYPPNTFNIGGQQNQRGDRTTTTPDGRRHQSNDNSVPPLQPKIYNTPGEMAYGYYTGVGNEPYAPTGTVNPYDVANPAYLRGVTRDAAGRTKAPSGAADLNNPYAGLSGSNLAAALEGGLTREKPVDTYQVRRGNFVPLTGPNGEFYGWQNVQNGETINVSATGGKPGAYVGWIGGKLNKWEPGMQKIIGGGEGYNDYLPSAPPRPQGPPINRPGGGGTYNPSPRGGGRGGGGGGGRTSTGRGVQSRYNAPSSSQASTVPGGGRRPFNNPADPSRMGLVTWRL